MTPYGAVVFRRAVCFCIFAMGFLAHYDLDAGRWVLVGAEVAAALMLYLALFHAHVHTDEEDWRDGTD